jgi:DNA processing protein
VQAYPVHLLSSPELDPSSPYRHLWQVSDPPKQLYVQGTEDALSLLEELPERGFAVVGTRQPQRRSLDLVERELSALADSSLIILSGLARGIDACAHEAAVRYDIPTIAILGAGLDQNYPRENAKLRTEILAAGGLLISEFPMGIEPRPHHFLLRNRLIAGWSKATWVVEASCRSGALNTARWAREQDRDCYATPCFPGDLTLEGNQKLIDRNHAIPFWETHSLGQTWLELAARAETSTGQKHLPIGASAHASRVPAEFLRLVTESTLSQGGILLQECLEWALSEGWEASDLFLAVRTATQAGCIQNRGGLLTASSRK